MLVHFFISFEYYGFILAGGRDIECSFFLILVPRPMGVTLILMFYIFSCQGLRNFVSPGPVWGFLYLRGSKYMDPIFSFG